MQHHLGSGDALEFDDGSFDRAMIIHVGMNIPDKEAVFAEVRRVLEIGGLFGVYEQMRVGDGEPTYPLPWAEDARSSFVEPVDTYVELLQQAGFVVEHTEDRTGRRVARPPDGHVAAESGDRIRTPIRRADRQQHRCHPGRHLGSGGPRGPRRLTLSRDPSHQRRFRRRVAAEVTGRFSHPGRLVTAARASRPSAS